MASLTAVHSKSATLSTTTVDTIAFSGVGDSIEIINRSSSPELSVTVDGTTPTALGDDTYTVPAAVGASITITNRGRFNAPVVKVIGSANAYSVQLFQGRR